MAWSAGNTRAMAADFSSSDYSQMQQAGMGNVAENMKKMPPQQRSQYAQAAQDHRAQWDKLTPDQQKQTADLINKKLSGTASPQREVASPVVVQNGQPVTDPGTAVSMGGVMPAHNSEFKGVAQSHNITNMGQNANTQNASTQSIGGDTGSYTGDTAGKPAKGDDRKAIRKRRNEHRTTHKIGISEQDKRATRADIAEKKCKAMELARKQRATDAGKNFKVDKSCKNKETIGTAAAEKKRIPVTFIY